MNPSFLLVLAFAFALALALGSQGAEAVLGAPISKQGGGTVRVPSPVPQLELRRGVHQESGYIEAEMRSGRTQTLVLATFVLSMGTKGLVAEVAANPYQGIVERNVFALKPPPRPEDALPPPQPPPKITLTGITTILGNKRALLKQQVPAKPPAPAREESYILTEGQREGDVEVLAIDEEAGTVKVNNHGTVQELSFDKDGVKLSNNASAPAAVPAIGPGGGLALPPLRGNPNAAAMKKTPGAPPPAGPLTRTLRLPQMPGSPATPAPPGQPGPGRP
jgi:hypothetical protein